MKWTFLVLALFAFQASQVAAEPEPERTVKSPVNLKGDILIGQSVSNRVLIAVDKKPSDGLVDYFLDFVPGKAFEGARWVRFLPDSHLQLHDGQLTVKGRDHSFGASMSVGGTEPADLGSSFAELYVLDSGIGVGFFVPSPDAARVSITSINYDHLYAWPEDYWYDYHDPRSGNSLCNWPNPSADGWGDGTQGSCLHPTFPDTAQPKNCEATCDNGSSQKTCSGTRFCCCGCGPSTASPAIDVVRHKCIQCTCPSGSPGCQPQ